MSSFIDIADIDIKAGNGGDGLTSFRREKFVDRGGPDGGDGGKGGNVVAVATRNVNTLQNFRHLKTIAAEDGQPGGPQKKHGRSGEDVTIEVPIGTIIRRDQITLADLREDSQSVIIAYGGDGGFGNAHFVSSTRQAPRVAEKGEEGDAFQATLELKLLADVGLIGLPNAGKSTLLSVVSNARPEIADYPFTTLVPNLGVADIDDTSLLIADIPGLIAGASAGKGLGDTFLRHVERTAVLLHLIDAYQNDVVKAYQTIQAELKHYQVDLTRKPQLVAVTKVEGLDADIVTDVLAQLQAVVPAQTLLFAISAQAKQGTTELLRELKEAVELARAMEAVTPSGETTAQIAFGAEDITLDWQVTKTAKYWLIQGEKIQKFARRTDFDNEWGVDRLRDIMNKLGIMHELARQGAQPGDTLKFKGARRTIKY
jgi:GTP-binding protein